MCGVGGVVFGYAGVGFSVGVFRIRKKAVLFWKKEPKNFCLLGLFSISSSFGFMFCCLEWRRMGESLGKVYSRILKLGWHCSGFKTLSFEAEVGMAG